MTHTNRRQFLAAGAAIAGAAVVSPLAALADSPKKPIIRIAVKYGMIGGSGSVREKFDLVKKIGYEGVEIDSPSGLNLKEAVAASQATGVKIHGVVDSVHWGKPLSSPDAAVRAEGLKALLGAIRDAKVVGADTVLLVPGVVNKDATYEQCYERSQVEVRKAIPLAEELGVKIAIETVWNNFITKPEQLIQYVDDLKSPAVGAYFDCSNMLKYGVPAETWIRKLGKRLFKFDFKAYNTDKAKSENNEWAGFKVEIGDGSENWPEILTALGELGYDGWATSEVGGGGEARLTDIYKRMAKVLGKA
ncbi:sugar phosphate isomerase/epimerase family protein [Tuwongella immobilis]|uniref:Xylose isomerase-like TIM barrel domain-containing protein n=1 Tax=Tuwongella immobilis TaxID=692036 RepID=A0A6C2YY67_9BACT|nr:sugar phosphate isomerase/epimerase family protein [Tuwongella immobilis]VIP05779.1 Xylose isomerase domain protein TIM barrel OS=Planctomyces limnophilus (strain ATCC 43296 / DSM 3776 / IFAM 1008 / 290) GN=Plim_1208 PE=4 SV=1: AP_endonuc_2 [Tuwongella immobilis]VTS08914.1 Xylose isomerase domain protein TIM barrel OS=Planctomyces limnophilus (strain ATCC 43296 / DSM 3776 / IFAM 1008 / 290) GN=Plim_1208 PE=4 SV=1: AP_endonuc_2 [Tuwongella immobilis]